jgi:hypothetical protein
MGEAHKSANDEVRQSGIQQYVYAVASGNGMGAAMYITLHNFTKEEQHSMNIDAFKLRFEKDLLSAVRSAEKIMKKIDITPEEKRAAAAEVLSSLGDYAKMVKTVTIRDEAEEKEAEKFSAIWQGIIRPQMEREL